MAFPDRNYLVYRWKPFMRVSVHTAAHSGITKGNEMMITEKTIRGDSQWVKITRDNKNRTFTFAHGYAGQYQAHNIMELPFKWIANWTEAIDHANRTIATYA
jgi:hypothetical protein